MDKSKTFQQIQAYAKAKGLPLIPFQAKNASVLKGPSAFYDSLLIGARQAERRIALSALYIGAGFKEKALVQALSDNLNQSNGQLAVKIALDANRARRGDHLKNSSIDTLRSVLSNESVSLNLINTNLSNSVFHRLLSRFDNWNELASTYHAKFIIFDEDIIITGANLSSIYFEKRQDRYLKIQSSKLLSDYVYRFLSELERPSLQFENAIDMLNESFNSSLKKMEQDETHDSYILPLFQHGPSGLHSCDDFLKFLDSILPKQAHITMSSGYFNPRFQLNLSSVLCPSEQANGFHNGAGLLKYVPRLYTALIKNYMDANPNCNFRLFSRPGWSFHAKGLWVEGLGDLTIQMIGSSNFNWRSSTRDFEMQFLLITKNQDLSATLREEGNELWKDSHPIEHRNFAGLNSLFTIAASVLKSLL